LRIESASSAKRYPAKSRPKKTLESHPYKIAVVGQSLGSAQFLLQLKKLLPNHELYWFKTGKEQRLKTEKTSWTLMTQPLNSEYHANSARYPIFEAPIFFNGRHRMLIRHLVEKKNNNKKNSITPLLHKLLSLAIWNDTSPELWSQTNKIPSPNHLWTRQKSMSFDSFKLIKDLFVVNRWSLLKKFDHLLQNEKVHIEQENRCVLGLKVLKNQANELVFNAPFSSLTYDRVIWFTQQETPNQEKNSQKIELSDFPDRSIGKWVSRGAWVDRSCITALPRFSVWLNQDQESLFMKTGLFGSRFIRRVYAIPLEEMPQGLVDESNHLELNNSLKNPFWLQIDEMELFENKYWVPDFLKHNSIKTQNMSETQFLWETCPLLKARSIQFTDLEPHDDALFFDSPVPRTKDLGFGVHGIYSGSLPLSDNFFNQVLTQLKIPQS
jgi:hypothetical protein